MISDKLRNRIENKVNPLVIQGGNELLSYLSLLSKGDIVVDQSIASNIYRLGLKNGDKVAAGAGYSIKKLLLAFNDLYGETFDVINSRKVGYTSYYLFLLEPDQTHLLPVKEEPTVEITEVITEEIISTKVEEPLSERYVEEPEWDKMVPVKYSKKALKEYAAEFGIELDIKPKYKELVAKFKEEWYHKYGEQ